MLVEVIVVDAPAHLIVDPGAVIHLSDPGDHRASTVRSQQR
jgi:hypothetical protein